MGFMTEFMTEFMTLFITEFMTGFRKWFMTRFMTLDSWLRIYDKGFMTPYSWHRIQDRIPDGIHERINHNIFQELLCKLSSGSQSTFVFFASFSIVIIAWDRMKYVVTPSKPQFSVRGVSIYHLYMYLTNFNAVKNSNSILLLSNFLAQSLPTHLRSIWLF